MGLPPDWPRLFIPLPSRDLAMPMPPRRFPSPSLCRTLSRRLPGKLACLALCLFLCLSSLPVHAAQPATAGTVCLLLESLTPDKGWHDQLRAGLARAEKDFGITARVVAAPADSDQQAIFREEAARSDLVLVADDSLHEVLRNNAGNFRKVHFGCIDTGVRAANIMSVTFADEQAAFLAGAAAAMLTVSDSRGMNPQKTLGWLSGKETGPIVTMLNGFLEGARLIDPEIRIVHRSLDSFEDTQRALASCRELLAEGADIVVLAAGSAGLAALDVLAGQQALAIGMAEDQDRLRPGQVLTSILKQGDRAVYEIVSSHVRGNFRGGEIVTYTLADKGVGITDLRSFAAGEGNKLPPRLASRLTELRRELERQAIRLPSLRQGTLCNCR